MKKSRQIDVRQLFILMTCVCLSVPALTANYRHAVNGLGELTVTSGWVVSTCFAYASLWSLTLIVSAYLLFSMANQSAKLIFLALAGTASFGILLNLYLLCGT